MQGGDNRLPFSAIGWTQLFTPAGGSLTRATPGEVQGVACDLCRIATVTFGGSEPPTQSALVRALQRATRRSVLIRTANLMMVIPGQYRDQHYAPPIANPRSIRSPLVTTTSIRSSPCSAGNSANNIAATLSERGPDVRDGPDREVNCLLDERGSMFAAAMGRLRPTRDQSFSALLSKGNP